jgi:predicted ATP-grasp superfamily ATP-dependent carboligase
MSILFGTPTFPKWLTAISKHNNALHKIILSDLNNISTIIDLIKQHDIFIIIPCTYAQMSFISKHKTTLNDIGIYNILCNDSTINNIEILNDKCNFIKFMQSDQNLVNYIPKVLHLKHGSDNIALDQQQNEVQFPTDSITYPCILKKAISYAGNGSKIYTSKSQLISDKINLNTNDLIIQEYIAGSVEYGGHFLVINGHIIFKAYYSNTHASNQKLYIQRGHMNTYKKVNIDRNIELVFNDIFIKLNYTGFACIDFKIQNGNPTIFEINPRLGGTLVLDKQDLNKALTLLKWYYLQNAI